MKIGPVDPEMVSSKESLKIKCLKKDRELTQAKRSQSGLKNKMPNHTHSPLDATMSVLEFVQEDSTSVGRSSERSMQIYNERTVVDC